MNPAAIVWGRPDWLIPAALLLLAVAAVAAWSYMRSPGPVWLRSVALLLRLTAAAALALCLIEPLFSGVRPRPQANRFLILADNSQSMTLRGGGKQTRGEQVRSWLAKQADWQTHLAQGFEVRRYTFDTTMRSVEDFEDLDFQGPSSNLSGSLQSLARRLQNVPAAGVLLLTDGNATDGPPDDSLLQSLPPIYPVVFPEQSAPKDVRIQRVAVSQTNFEAAPVSVMAEVSSVGFAGANLVVELLDESGQSLERQALSGTTDDRSLAHRFQFRPEKSGVSFYQVRVIPEAETQAWEKPLVSSEATLANNRRWLTVDRGEGPYRILYVTGRPNWDFKFLRRAAMEDDEIRVVGLVRIAKREPKFTFRGNRGETTNPLYRGFDNQQDEQAEQYDEPVLIRLGTEDEEELRDGFPKDAETLFRYHAIVLDDLESGFFTQDQMSLIQQFVSQRGGGLLMLGGQESFAAGAYDHTPIGEMLPVYLGRVAEPIDEDQFRLRLTREGWLQPWVRLRATEADEQLRLAAMPELRVLNQASGLKPGASILAEVETRSGKPLPALVVQRFGRGQTGALLLGDLWRWSLRRAEGSESDLEKAWRQTLRWLVSDVPSRVEVEVRPAAEEAPGTVELAVTARDSAYQPLDDAAIVMRVIDPESKTIELQPQPSDQQAGSYTSLFTPRASGPHRVHVEVKTAEAEPVGQCAAGWSSDASVDEFDSLAVNRQLLEQLAQRTGGEVVAGAELGRFVASLSSRKVPVVETWSYPLWHQWPAFLFAVACLIGEWGLRRWRGLP